MSVEKLDFSRVIQSKKGFTGVLNDVVQNIPDAFILGVYIYLSTLPSGWNINRNHLMKHFNIGRDKLSKALSWLNANFLISYHSERNNDGTVDKWQIIVHEGWEFLEKVVNNQQSESTILKTRSVDSSTTLKNQSLDKPVTGKTAPINTTAFKKETQSKRETVCKKRQTLLPPDFNPSKQNLDLCKYRGLDPDTVIGKFLSDRKSKGIKRIDWQEDLTKWILDEKVKKITTQSTMHVNNNQNETRCTIQFWEKGNPDYDRVNG